MFGYGIVIFNGLVPKYVVADACHGNKIGDLPLGH
jgi:hypothetical protein